MEEVDLNNREDKIKELLDEFLTWRSITRAKSPRTLEADRDNVTQFFKWYGDRNIAKIAKTDIRKFLTWLETATYTPRSKKGQPPKDPVQYSDTSKFQKKKCVRVFLKWLHIDYDSSIPDLSGEIVLGTPKTKRQIEKTLTMDDVEKLINGCLHPRDQAMLAFLIDSGVRRSELLAITYGGVQFVPGGGVQVMVPPKKHAKELRRVFCIYSSQRMRVWYDCHPTKQMNDPLFCSLHPPYGEWSKQGQWEQMRAIAQRAGFTDVIWNHLFRHSAATLYAKFHGMNSYKINQRFGWGVTSPMGDRYIHLSGQESDDDIRMAFGAPIPIKNNIGEHMISCPTCKEQYHVGIDRCKRCGRGLSTEAIEADEELEAQKEAERVRILTEHVTQHVLRSLGLDQTSDIESKIKSINSVSVMRNGKKRVIDGDALNRFLESEASKEDEDKQG
jgi:site-specific recombinase XerD